ncbi:MAG: FAD-binding oxidoreductase [Deltaproteobacteria bacterium]|nr:FAD-binding oxidoreductase [Deltaproteobacteria bacterium]
MAEPRDALVIGGGFYGACLALVLASRLSRVVLLEKEDDLLTRASSLNQARVHTGYHYPRSFLTAYRSLVNFPRFLLDFRRAIVDDFTKLYAVARRGSKVSAERFFKMFKEMGAPIAPAAPQLARLFNPELIEAVFKVREVAFDAAVLRDILRERLEAAGVEIRLGEEAVNLTPGPGEGITVTTAGGRELPAGLVFLCAYSRINVLLAAAGLPLLPLKHEITEMALVELPPELAGLGITVMDGPFFSVMPYPSRGLHTLSHVRYTPHASWTDGPRPRDGHALLRQNPPASNFLYMQKDAQRYLPALARARQAGSLFEVKTVLVRNEVDDGRPILFQPGHGLPQLNVIMGGKIDNIYDILELLAAARSSLGVSGRALGRLFRGE